MREEFEGWYIVKFLFEHEMPVKEMASQRNNEGGYDIDHIDGAWEAWKHCAAKNG